MSPRQKTPTLNDLQKEIDQLKAVVADMRRPVVQEESRLVLPKTVAKGSNRIPVIAAAPEPPPAEEPLARRVEALLRIRSRSYTELVDDLGEPDARVAGVFAGLRRRGKVANVGTDVQPRWLWVIGDSISTPDLRSWVENLVRDRPMTYHQLVEVVGANPNRIKGVLTDLQRRETDPVRNFGSKAKALWYIPPSK